MRDYPKPSVTVDAVVFDKDWNILLIKRKFDPFKDCWALPGGFVNPGEDLELACQRELQEETNVLLIFDKIAGAYGVAGRDPRGWTISVAYVAYDQNFGRFDIKAKDDAALVEIFSYDSIKILPLAFDHREIITEARRLYY